MDYQLQVITSNRRALTALNQGAAAVFFFDAFDDYEECARRMTFYGLFTSADHIYKARKRYFATRQLYHFVPPGAQRIGAVTVAPGLTVSAFHDAASQSLVLVGVKEGGSNRIVVELASAAVPAWDLYMTTPSADCAKAATVQAGGRTSLLDLPDEVIFTLVGRLSK